MPMGMLMPGEHCNPATHRRVERVVPEGRPMFVVVVVILAVPVTAVVVMFCKAGAIRMCMAVVFDRHDDLEVMGFWNFFEGLPKPFPHGERKQLALARLPPCFQLYPICRWAGQAEPWRRAIFVDGELNDPMAGVDALQLRAMDLVGRVSGQERKIVAVTVAVLSIPSSRSSTQVTPCGYGDPAAERDQGDARGSVDEMTEASGDRDACDPNDCRNDQGRDNVTNARLERRAGCLGFRPAPLPGKKGNWNPVIRDDGVQDANNAN